MPKRDDIWVLVSRYHLNIDRLYSDIRVPGRHLGKQTRLSQNDRYLPIVLINRLVGIVQLPPTKLGHDAIFVFVDRLTKMVHFAPTTGSRHYEDWRFPK